MPRIIDPKRSVLLLAITAILQADPATSPTDPNTSLVIHVPKPIVIDKASVPKPPKLDIEGGNSTQIRSIHFSKRYPPGYTPLEERIAKRFAKTKSATTNHVGGVNAGRIATYLRGPLLSLDEAKKRLQDAGFTILSTVPLTKKKDDHTLIVFTSEQLSTFAAKHHVEFLADMHMDLDREHNQTTITNPLYLAKAFMGDHYEATIPQKTLEALSAHIEGLRNSKEALKFEALPHYRFMHGMPGYKEMDEVALGDDLIAKLQHNKHVAYLHKLPNGSVVAGMLFRRRTQKFPYRIGSQNAALLPYPVLIKDNKAVILDPKYYIALMYPLLKMSQFMHISSIPDSIVREAGRLFR